MPIDAQFVNCGIILHDIGKTLYPNELDEKGSLHEAAGRALLLSKNVDSTLAQVCVSHAAWQEATTLEEWVITLSDKLWKGKRVPDLEERIIRRVAGYWELFTELDSCFEDIASEGDERLTRSLVE